MSDRDLALLRQLARPGYLVAALLVVLPLFDLAANVWPPRFGELQWRYGTLGLVSGFLLTPMLGMLLALGFAALLDHRTVIRVLSVAGWVAALLLVAGALLFTLDALQFRGNAPPEALRTFDVGLVKALLKDFAVAVALGWIGVVGWRGSKQSSSRAPRATSPVIRPDAG